MKRTSKQSKQKKVAGLPKYAYGGSAMDILSPSDELAKSRRIVDDSIIDSQNNTTVLGLQMLSNAMMGIGSNMAMAGLGQANEANSKLDVDKQATGVKKFMLNNGSTMNSVAGGLSPLLSFAMGGKVPINVEGDEIVETPQGQTMEMQGPSHAQGGIDLNVPEGTDIYSKRVKGPDGKSMADRKKARERQLNKIQKLVDNNPTDKTLKATLEKTKRDFDLQDKQDVAYMQQLHLAKQQQKFAKGGKVNREHYDLGSKVLGDYKFTPGTDINTTDLLGLNKILLNPIKIDTNVWDTSEDSLAKARTITGEKEHILTPEEIAAGQAYDKKQKQGQQSSTSAWDTFKEDIPSYTIGDLTGIAGQLYSTFANMKNTQAMRDGDTPNVNAFKHYGEDGLKRMEQSEQYVGQQRDNNLQDLELSRQGTINRNSNSARGVNTLRALNLATDSAADKTKAGIYNQFSQLMQNIMQGEAQMMNNRDAQVMQGEQNRDDADRHDRDAYFAQMARDIASTGYGLQNIGSTLNQAKQRTTTNNLMNQMYEEFGVNSMTGQIKAKAIEEIQKNPGFFAGVPSTQFDPIMSKIHNDGWKIQGNYLVDKDGNKYDKLTLTKI